MALGVSPFPLNFLSPPYPRPISSSARFRKNIVIVSCSQQTVQIDPAKKKKRKPKPSFSDQIRDKWSTRNPSLKKKFPWQERSENQSQEYFQLIKEEDEEKEAEEGAVTESEIGINSLSTISPDRLYLAPWVHGNGQQETQFDAVTENVDNFSEHNLKNEAGFDPKFEGSVEIDEIPVGLYERKQKLPFKAVEGSDTDGTSSIISGKIEKARLPWERGRTLGNVNGGYHASERNTMLAEKLIPQNELKRLRNVSLRMVERIKVGPAGVNQELVDSIHAKWREDEVVKLKFEGPPAQNMKRTLDILENRTGGIAIWRSGSSIVLYRGMSYNLPCVQSYTKQDTINTCSHSSPTVEDVVGARESSYTRSTRNLMGLSEEEIKDFRELDNLLEDLGPRFKDWSGPEPLPVDADLLPPVVPGYRRPFRLLPYGVRQSLRDKETTFYRQTARKMPPHFALGRNRELQGLAMAMVKLWDRNAVAKIAIKRGVQNTNNERMAEELKILTGGTLLSRNKEYIIFYRGNDFLPPTVTNTLNEAQKLAVLKVDEEDMARRQSSLLICSSTKSAKVPLVAGTLGETIAATSRWGNQPCTEEIERMRRDSGLARHASMVRYLENKLAIAKGKIKKAEKALRKVQESLKPAELPTDLETITDEERFLFRKIGLSMKPYLLLGKTFALGYSCPLL